MIRRACATVAAAALFAVGLAHAQDPQGTFRIWPVRSDPVLQAYYPLETVDDAQGLTAQVGGPAMVTAISSAVGFPPRNGILYWNPATNAFKEYRVGQSGGTQFAVDIDRSTPSAGPPVVGGGDVWGAITGTAGPYVHLRGSDVFRSWPIATRPMGLRLNPANGRVYITERRLGNWIYELDPATNQVRGWLIGNVPWFLATGGNFVYATAVAEAGYPDQILRLDVVTSTLSRWDVPGGGFYGANVVGIFNSITRDAEGQVWFTESASNEIGRLDPVTGELREYTKPGIAFPSGIATTGAGPTLQAFFDATSSNYVGLLVGLQATPATTTTVIPAVQTIVPTVAVVLPTDTTEQPVTTTIPPEVLASTGTDPEGIFLFPNNSPAGYYGPAGLSRVTAPQTVFGSLVGGGAVFQFSGPTVLPEPAGMVSGHGAIAQAGGTATFTFNVRRTQAGGPVSGSLQYVNRVTDESVRSVDITTLGIAGNAASFGGTCTNNGVACTFTVTVQDNADPGAGQDVFTIDGEVIVPATGTLTRGNVQVREGQ